MNKYILMFMVFFSVTANAQDCDCTRKAGTCSATYRIVNINNDPQSINSSAELALTSSARLCSKITYLVDSMPFVALLKTGSTATESIFGTTQINDRTVSIDSCRVCALTNSPQNPTGDSASLDYFLGNESALAVKSFNSLPDDDSATFLDALGAIQDVIQQNKALMKGGRIPR